MMLVRVIVVLVLLGVAVVSWYATTGFVNGRNLGIDAWIRGWWVVVF
jgi:hypothetical protein